jgi:medium-chain acyl-[acyl-carrier-protein] hydrolase
MEKINIWTEAFKVRSYQMDMKARATITAIAGWLQEVAGNHASYMGFGYNQMKQSGLYWLLTRVKIHVHSYPEWGEDLEVNTWVVNAEKFFSRRDFEIRNKEGNTIVSASTGWMLVNAFEKRPQLVESLSRNIDLLKDKLALNEELQKIEALENPDSTHLYKVKYSDIDIVNHVNNIQYYNIILDTLPNGFRKENHIQSFEINYIAEALLDEDLQVLNRQLNNNHLYQHEIKRLSDDKVVCRAMSKWGKDK